MCADNFSWSHIALRLHMSQSCPFPDHAFHHSWASSATSQPAEGFWNYSDPHNQTVLQFCYVFLGNIKEPSYFYSTVLFLSFNLFDLRTNRSVALMSAILWFLWIFDKLFCSSFPHHSKHPSPLFTCSSSYFYYSFMFKTCRTWFSLMYFLSFNMKQLIYFFHLPVTLAMLSFFLDFHSKREDYNFFSAGSHKTHYTHVLWKCDQYINIDIF